MELKPPNYLVLSIITMVLFCWIFGLIGLLVGMQVRGVWLVGGVSLSSSVTVLGFDCPNYITTCCEQGEQDYIGLVINLIACAF